MSVLHGSRSRVTLLQIKCCTAPVQCCTVCARTACLELHEPAKQAATQNCKWNEAIPLFLSSNLFPPPPISSFRFLRFAHKKREAIAVTDSKRCLLSPFSWKNACFFLPMIILLQKKVASSAHCSCYLKCFNKVFFEGWAGSLKRTQSTSRQVTLTKIDWIR